MRIIAGLLAAMLVCVYFLMVSESDPVVSVNNNGRVKQVLEEPVSAVWVPDTPVSELTCWFSGASDHPDASLTLRVEKDGQPVASADTRGADLLEGKYASLSGSFAQGTVYTLIVSSDDPSIKLRGETLEDGSFHPWIQTVSVSRSRNPLLLYLALGLILIALTPLSDRPSPQSVRLRRTRSDWLLPAAAFLTVAGTGLLILFLKPPYSPDSLWAVWDEDAHRGNILAMTTHASLSLSQAIAGVTTWAPGYLCHILGVELASLFTGDTSAMFLTGCCLSVLCSALLLSLAVGHAPRYKASFLAAGLLPTCIFQAAGVTYDATVIYCVLLGFALLLKTLEEDQPLRAVRGIALLFLLAFGTVAKPAYCTVLLPVLCVPREKLGSRPQAWAFRVLILLLIVWSALSVALPGPYDSMRSGDERFADVDAAAQMQYLLAHPLEWIGVPVRYFVSHWQTLLVLDTAKLCALGTNPAVAWIGVGLLLLLAPLAVVGERKETRSLLTSGRRIVFALVALLSEFVLILTQYLVSSPVGGTVRGMQGRYILPVWIALALALMLPRRLRSRMAKAGPALALVLCAAFLVLNLAYVLSRPR